MHLQRLERTYPVATLQEQLEDPAVWNRTPFRTALSESPHRETSDIVVRYNPLSNFHGDMRAFNAEHIAEWYPVIDLIPEARRLATQIATDHESRQLGMVLITCIPPGKQVYPHIDVGWHARHYEKFALQVKGDEHQAFHFENEQLITQDGDLFWFDNSKPHWVTNDSDRERITMIVCLRRS